MGFKRNIRVAPDTNVIEWNPSPLLVKWAKYFNLKLDPMKNCLRSEPNMRFRKNYLTKLLQKTLLRCDVKSSKSLKSFSKKIFFCSGLRNTRSLGKGDRYQHQDNQMISLVLLNNTNDTLQCTDLQIVGLVSICRLRSTSSAVVTIDTNNNGLRPINVFIVIIPFRPAHTLTRLWRSRRWRRLYENQAF